jgi:hypothetical protein
VATSSIAIPGTFSVEVDLSSSVDVNGRPLMFFPVVLRGEGSVQVARIGAGRYQVTGSYPVDEVVFTGGQDRIVSRSTIAFFPHKGMWLGTPAMFSVGGRDADEAAPNANNLD